jgi:hypothetical protein
VQRVGQQLRDVERDHRPRIAGVELGQTGERLGLREPGTGTGDRVCVSLAQSSRATPWATQSVTLPFTEQRD